MNKPLTDRQAHVFNWMLDFLAEEDRLPTQREIAAKVGSKNNNPRSGAGYIIALVKKGFLEKRGLHYRIAR